METKVLSQPSETDGQHDTAASKTDSNRTLFQDNIWGWVILRAKPKADQNNVKGENQEIKEKNQGIN